MHLLVKYLHNNTFWQTRNLRKIKIKVPPTWEKFEYEHYIVYRVHVVRTCVKNYLHNAVQFGTELVNPANISANANKKSQWIDSLGIL